MADEIIDDGGIPPEPTPEPVIPPEPQMPPDWAGRVKAEQEATDAALASAGMRLNRKSGQLEYLPGYGHAVQNNTYQAPNVQPEEEEFDPYDRAQIDKRVQQGVAQGLAALTPLFESLTATAEAARNTDWKEIEPEVKQELAGMGVTLIMAKAQLPQLLDAVSDAVRFRKSKTVTPTAPPVLPNAVAIAAEQARLAAIAAAAGAGGAPSTSPTGVDSHGLSADDLAEANRLGLSAEEYTELASGPATIKLKGVD